MKLHPPFIITARLLPGLRLGDAWLGLTGIEPSDENRDCATFALDFADGSTYTDSSMRSGCGGFKGPVSAFNTFLSFLLAAVESLEYEQRTGRAGDNADLFPRHVVEWALDNKSDIESAQMDICGEEGSPNEYLIKE